MIAFWSSKKLHKGHITMLGRVMAGSQAVVTHALDGQVIYFEYHAPDLHLTHILVEYCQKLRDLTGIEVFVVDRAANSLELARAFEEAELGLLCMLGSNQYKGLESFHATFLAEDKETNSLLYRCEWLDEKKRASDPREFVAYVSEEKTLVYTGTKVVKEHFRHEEWPGLYRERTEKQENSFKRMHGHGALDINYGTKSDMGPDRHEQRKRAELETKLQRKDAQLEKTKGEIEEWKEKVRESEERGHTKRLASRKKHLKEQRSQGRKQRKEKKKLEQKLEQVEEGKERGDRDYRKQSVMTFRTCLLENLLTKFLCVLFGGREWKAGIETWLELMKRSGGYLEKTDGWEFWFDGQGLSDSYRRLLESLVLSVNKAGIEWEGKPILARIRDGTS